jgi:hypothetical protein
MRIAATDASLTSKQIECGRIAGQANLATAANEAKERAAEININPGLTPAKKHPYKS